MSIGHRMGVLTGVPNKVAEDYWWAVLEAEPGSRKRDYLRTLPESLQDGFDCLLPITGIWAGMNIGVLHKLKAMKCDETFLRLVDGNVDLLSKIDSSTVKFIKSRAPKVSPQDLADMQEEWDKHKLFCFMDEHHRKAAWERLKEIDFLIPTLETFFQDVLFLDVGRTVLRQLCLTPPKGEGTIDQTLRSQYTGYPPAFLSRTYWDKMIVDGSLCDLWRFSLQYAFEMTNKRDHHRRVPRKHKDKTRAIELGLNEWRDRDSLSLLHHFLALASRHEFNVPFRENYVSTEIELSSPPPYDFPPEAEGDVDIERRCGNPFTDSIDADIFALSREALRNDWSEQRVSACFVRRCVFLAFFSYLIPEDTDRQISGVMGPVYDDTTINLEGDISSLSTSSSPDIQSM
ncbi:hypothetical protein N7466_011110 [Penicillium verhagenii]|uniref:uncharacterized protein n=1 Tax=Penicillium verhagenii TaxID=1562060 RepID=UPI00254530D8|nr:uncharacterized protein N7466_011110 [Penicillium verhagenii]KAJ5917556.1 hypothetical protein N7466_011110 [Penicillium verhagenii]